MRIRALALCSAAGVLFAGQALATDATISNHVTTPVHTSNASGDGTPGNVTVAAGGDITLTDPGAALTVDSNNVVINNGTLANSADTGAIGLHLLGGVTAGDADTPAFSGTGSIVVVAPAGDTNARSDNYGILLDGAGTFTGDLDVHSMSLQVTGDNSAAIAINTTLAGNITLGNASVAGSEASLFRSTANIDGSLKNLGSVISEAIAYTTTDIDPFGGSTFAIGGDLSGGFLNAGPVDTSDTTTVAGSIQLVGGCTLVAGADDCAHRVNAAIEFSPSIAGAGAPSTTIGILDDETNAGFSLINRGSIAVNGNDPGVSTTAIFIGREPTDAGSHTVTLAGGIYNRGAIRADSTSNNAGATNVAASDADATAIHIAAGGNAGRLVNDVGGAVAAATQGGPAGGTAIGVLVDAGGSLTTIVNNGTISALAGTSALSTDPAVDNLTAVAIWDKSGTITSVTNTGIISAEANDLNGVVDPAHIHVLIGDFSANTTTLDFTNSGTLNGDIVFGQGTSTFTIAGADAVVSGNYHATGAGHLDIDVAEGTLTTASTQAHDLHVEGHGIVGLTVPAGTNTTPVIALTGDASFNSGSRVVLGYQGFLGDGATITLVHADGSITTEDLAGLTDQTKPFIYNTTFTNDGHDLVLNVSRKTAAQLGFAGNVATVYEPAIQAIASDPNLGIAVMKLTDQESTVAAFQSMVPTGVNGAQRNYAIFLTGQEFGAVAARQRTLIEAPNESHGIAFWAQEIWMGNENDGSAGVPGYSDNGFGVAAGVDFGALSTGRYGLAFTHFNGDSVEGDPRVAKIVNNWTIFSFYADWRDSDTGLFATTNASGGIGSFESTRRILAGDYQPNAKGHWTGWLGAGSAQVGDIIGDDTFALIPSAGVDALYMDESGYHERGAGGANLAVSDRSNTSLRGFLGLSGRAQFEFAGGYIRPELHIGWSHEFAGHPADANVYFISAQNTHFRISGPAEPVSSFVGGGSLSFVYNNWSVGGDYDRTLGSSTTSEAGSLMVSGHF